MIQLLFLLLQRDLTDVMIPCHIAGMDEPLLLSITAKVEWLQIAYAIQDSPNLPLVLPYIYICQVSLHDITVPAHI